MDQDDVPVSHGHGLGSHALAIDCPSGAVVVLRSFWKTRQSAKHSTG
jgi:hypothetical protein